MGKKQEYEQLILNPECNACHRYMGKYHKVISICPGKKPTTVPCMAYMDDNAYRFYLSNVKEKE